LGHKIEKPASAGFSVSVPLVERLQSRREWRMFLNIAIRTLRLDGASNGVCAFRLYGSARVFFRSSDHP
jgi:hypothetical protein